MAYLVKQLQPLTNTLLRGFSVPLNANPSSSLTCTVNVLDLQGTNPRFTPRLEWSKDGDHWASSDIDIFPDIRATGSYMLTTVTKNYLVRMGWEIASATTTVVIFDATAYTTV